MIYRKYMKRLLDILISLFAIIVATPLMIISALLIKVSSRGPIFFLQERIGLGGRKFNLIKLRTMAVNPNRKLTQTTNHDPEVFPVGMVLRRLKLDELPQILNVLKGDMSIVGPRPCLEVTKTDMPKWAQARFQVRPGLTGLAQVNGNISLSWEERWKYDVKYVDNITFIRDTSLVLRTVLVVLLGEERFEKRL